MIKLIYFYIPDGNALLRQNDGDAPKRRSNVPRPRAEPLREDYVNLRLKRKQ